jgi:solute carrier family 25 oxoglutarate transporter 11
MSINVGMLACYDQAKESLGQYVFHDPADKPPSTQTQLGASLIAGFTATACSLPFDLLKSRMQDGDKYKGLPDAVIKIYTTEGILSFWTGFGAYYMRTAPHAMIILMTTQPITNYFKKTFKL